ncbi:hypothetical protein FJ945_29765 [Mesorhizobium sp. B2-4-9]|uniref:hypothetical protein n=1 Tax=Mesorhizobium sp. B2-4-9 TaxID=2589940 RepID=UPI00112A452A|nr:hypothetical protein [Mesorhizobium sp. B2-4-9]TPL14808.1 hypothetical protein FJ945_29765 [Mesorhizobium sp. B2-4-9]
MSIRRTYQPYLSAAWSSPLFAEEKRPWAAVEIALTPNGSPPATLICSAYRASQAGIVALILNQVDPRVVNKILDPVVRFLPLTIPGVIYLGMDNGVRMQEALFAAEVVFAATKPFRASLLSLGIDRRRIWPASSAPALLDDDVAKFGKMASTRRFHADNDRLRGKVVQPLLPI